jgi:hypothetical protein
MGWLQKMMKEQRMTMLVRQVAEIIQNALSGLELIGTSSRPKLSALEAHATFKNPSIRTRQARLLLAQNR